MCAGPDSCQCKDPKDDELHGATVKRHRMSRAEAKQQPDVPRILHAGRHHSLSKSGRTECDQQIFHTASAATDATPSDRQGSSLCAGTLTIYRGSVCRVAAATSRLTAASARLWAAAMAS